jgi:glyoxylate/hydroxypyruvate reductase A
MAVAIIVGRDEAEQHRFRWFTSEWKRVWSELSPSLDIRIWPEIGNPDEIDFILSWKSPFGSLKQFQNAKCIASLGAGVDHLIADVELPRHIPIVRVVDPYMINDITQYVLATVLHYVKQMDRWAQNQKQSLWERKAPFNFSDKTIGILGLGSLGKKSAEVLKNLGLNVIGWSNSPKHWQGIQTFARQDEFYDFLSQTDIAVCMLPLTPATQNILNQKTFSQLKKGAYLINLGRGEHIVDQDLITALDQEQLSGACLDVFYEEPLPIEHPFWKHSKIRVTPHIASITNPTTAGVQLYENYCRMMRGEMLLNQIDLSRGY